MSNKFTEMFGIHKNEYQKLCDEFIEKKKENEILYEVKTMEEVIKDYIVDDELKRITLTAEVKECKLYEAITLLYSVIVVIALLLFGAYKTLLIDIFGQTNKLICDIGYLVVIILIIIIIFRVLRRQNKYYKYKEYFIEIINNLK